MKEEFSGKYATKAKIISFITAVLLAVSLFCGCVPENKTAKTDYSDQQLWAIFENTGDKAADLFIVAPTVYYGDEQSFNMPLDDEKNRSRIIGALNMQRGIFDESLNIYSSYYRQASISAVEAGDYSDALNIAYEDVSAAFEYFIKKISGNRPFVLSGFSQGGDLCVRLMKDYPGCFDRMVACYIYGCAIDDETLESCPAIIPATGEDDTGVTVCINSEAPEIDDTFTVPSGKKSICINPLNWRTDSQAADKSLNKGACFTDYDGNTKSEIPEFCGAYIDTRRGTLKLPEVDPESYTSKLSFLKYGEYHLYEYEFFYRNLQENVKVRLDAWNEKQK